MNKKTTETLSGDNVRLEMSGGEVLAEMFKRHKVGPMFGMAGFQLLPFYDAVRNLSMDHTLIADERSGAFMADAWARVTCRPGVCDAPLGPGATNLLTALTESLNAGIPVIAMIGDTTVSYTHLTLPTIYSV